MDATPTIVQIQARHPFREPDWRMRHARRLVERGRRLSPRRDDTESIILVRFLRAQKRCHTDVDHSRLERDWPGLVGAQRLTQGDSQLRWEVESLLLAGQQDEEIAMRCGLNPQAIYWYEAAFFRVRDRLQATDWIMLRAVGGGPWNGFAGEQPGVLWRYAAYSGGVRLLDVFMAVTTNKPLPDWVRASFSKHPAYEEARLRLSCKLTIAAMTAKCPQEMKAAVEIHDQAEQLHRRVTGKAHDPDNALHVMEGFLKGLDYRHHHPNGNKASATTRPAAKTHDSVAATTARQRKPVVTD